MELQDVERITHQEPFCIVILGTSFAGLAVAHKFLRNTIEQLSVTRSSQRYKIILVGPSTCLYWNIGAPRIIADAKRLTIEESFVPFLPLFEEYKKSRFQYIQGKATSVDFGARTVAIEHANIAPSYTGAASDKEPESIVTKQTIKFHALVIATGSSAESQLLSLHGPHEKTVKELEVFQDRLVQSSSIIIAGGGPSGVECAGQLATWANKGKKKPAPLPRKTAPANTSDPDLEEHRTWKKIQHKATSNLENNKEKAADVEPGTGSADTRKTIILISGHDRLLPRLRPEFGAQAETKLKKLGVSVIHNYRVERAIETGSGNTRCVLNDEYTISCDLFIPATGQHPNTGFMPPEMLTSSGYIDVHPQSLRVPGVERVFAVGDCASHSKGSIQDVYDSIPVVTQNLKVDLLAYEYRMEHPYGGETAEAKLEALEDFAYVQNPTDSQLMPISRFGGVGILFGMKMPSFVVWLLKGRDYRIGRAKLAAGVGKDPYAVI